MKPLPLDAQWRWAVLSSHLRNLCRWRPSVRAVLALACALACLGTGPAWAEEAADIDVPASQNPYIQVVATLYAQSKYEEALSKLEKAQDSKVNGPQEELWLKLMQGVLQVELAPESALQTFKEALAMDPQAQLPVKKGSRRLRKLFEQARNTAGLPADLALEEEEDTPELPKGPPERRLGLSTSVRGEVDVLGLAVTRSIASVVQFGYTRERTGATLGLLVQQSPGLRAEGLYHPINLGWVRPYAGVGASAFFLEKKADEKTTFFGGMSGRGVLGVDVQWNSHMFAFADVAYEHFVTGTEPYRTQSLLFSLGVGLFPQTPTPAAVGPSLPR